MSESISRDQLERILGDVDDVLAARLVATTAPEELIVQALHDIESGERSFDDDAALPTYNQVRALLEELIARDEDFSYIDYATD